MAARRHTKKPQPRRILRFVLWGLLILQAVWLGAFIWATGAWLPFGQAWKDTRQRELDGMRIEEILETEASIGEGN